MNEKESSLGVPVATLKLDFLYSGLCDCLNFGTSSVIIQSFRAVINADATRAVTSTI